MGITQSISDSTKNILIKNKLIDIKQKKKIRDFNIAMNIAKTRER